MRKSLAAALFTLMAVALTVTSCGKYYGEGKFPVSSPDGRITVNFELKELESPYQPGPNMYYNVEFNGKKLLTDSPMGLVFGEKGALTGDVVVKEVVYNENQSDQFETPFGKQSSVSVSYNEMTVKVRERTIPAKDMDIIFRIYNDGVAFRFHLPYQKPDIKFPSVDREGFLEDFVITGDMTGYIFKDSIMTFAAVAEAGKHNYEAQYLLTPLYTITREMQVMMPLLATWDDGTAMIITEAGLADYPHAYLSSQRDMDLDLVTSLVPMFGEKEVKAYGTVPYTTPWHLLMIGESVGDLIESDLTLALNEPSKIADQSWIKPGKMAWDWWSNRLLEYKRNQPQYGRVNEDAKKTFETYIDFAAESGFEYCLIDAGWYGDDRDPTQDVTTPVDTTLVMEDLFAHADSAGVGIFLGVNWQNLQPAGDSLYTKLDSVLDVYGKWGVKGIKINYMNRDDLNMVRFYHKVLEETAARKMMVIFHSAYKPTGIQRTWPNLVTRDAVISSEADKFNADASPEHDVTIAFTRGVLGQMDYAPGAFINVYMDDFQASYTKPVAQGTRAHQLAMFVVYQSPIQTIPDAPANYAKEKGFDFIQLVPTVWDETRYISGEVGQYIVMARRNGDNWYLGAMTNELEREIELPLEFLGGGQWTMKSWADGDATMAEGKKRDMESLNIEEKEISSSETVSITLGPGGGFAAAFTKK